MASLYRATTRHLLYLASLSVLLQNNLERLISPKYSFILSIANSE